MHAVDPQIRLEMKVAGGTNLVTVEVSKARYREIGLNEGDEVFWASTARSMSIRATNGLSQSREVSKQLARPNRKRLRQFDDVF